MDAGARPQTSTTNPRLDGFLWIGRAGYSAGTCKGSPRSQRGGKRAGFWWEERGLLLARRSPARFNTVGEPLRFPVDPTDLGSQIDPLNPNPR